jgi:hypothetical protein
MPVYGALTVIIFQKSNSARFPINYCAELQLLSSASFLYIIWTHTTISHVNDGSAPTRDGVSLASTSSLTRPASPRLADVREPRKHSLPPLVNKNNFGYVWMSVPKNYRCVFRFFLFFYVAKPIGNQRVERRRYSDWFTSRTSHRIFSPFFLTETDFKWWDRSPCRLANRNSRGIRKRSHKIIGFASNSSFALQLGRP